ncbi:MAG: c-type cytochrome [Campylobacterota bacterium]|nr:c-type cytochrome [Campylobacterota bacterium]
MKYLLIVAFLSSLVYSSDAKFEMGKKIYESACISCHGVDGTSDTNMKLIVEPRALSKTVLTQEQSYHIIKDGSHYWGSAADMMPAFKHVYLERELRSVAYYITKAFHPNVQKKIDELYTQSDVIPEAKKSKMLKRGKKIYKRNCSWCHGVEAKGDGEASRNPELSIFPYDLTKTLLTDKQMFLYIKYGGKYWGTHKDDMPSWSRKYDDFTIKSVVRYIEETFRNQDENR